MMRLRMKAKDDGATLVLVLVIVTTIAIVTGATLSYGGTNIKATVALRDQAGSAYDGDGAAQVAIDKLKKGTFWNVVNPNDPNYEQCFGGSGTTTTTETITLKNFYPATKGLNGNAQSSAVVECVVESGTGAEGGPVPINNSNNPPYAVLTLGTSPNVGQVYEHKTVLIQGPIRSNSNITGTAVLIVGAGATSTGTCTITSQSACTAGQPTYPDPNYPAPTTSLSVPASKPPCTSSIAATRNASSGKTATFLPGIYHSRVEMEQCASLASTMVFTPGTYYFDFTDATGGHLWSTSNMNLVAGTLTSTAAAAVASNQVPPDMTNACVSPLDATTTGVQFVMGGDTQFNWGKGAEWDVCASSSSTSLPIAIYGLKSDLGGGAVHGQSGCVLSTCDVISTGNNGHQPDVYINGSAYLPLDTIGVFGDFQFNNSGRGVFNYGITARSLDVRDNPQLGNVALFSVPFQNPGNGQGAGVILDLNVYVCPGAGTCSKATGHLQLTARVLMYDSLGDPNANGNVRTAKVLSYSNRR